MKKIIKITDLCEVMEHVRTKKLHAPIPAMDKKARELLDKTMYRIAKRNLKRI